MLRDTWTKKLARIIGDIEAGKPPVPVTELYVFGAYTRGESDPQELDIVVIHDEPSPALLEQYRLQAKRPSRSIIAALRNGIKQFESHLYKVLRRPTERINIYHGSQVNQAYVPTRQHLEGLLFLWSPSDRDWQAKIATIPLPPHGGDASMKPVALQLPDTLAEEVHYLSQLVGLQQIQMIRISLDDLPKIDYEQALAFLASPSLLDRWGVNTKELFPYACAWLTTQNITEAMATDGSIVFDHDFRFRIQLGKPHFQKMVKHFDRMELEKQCYIPFFTKGYAKEVVVLERGSAWTPTQELS